MKTKVLIEISGGNVTNIITSSKDVEVVIIDNDNINQADNAEEDIEYQCMPMVPDAVSENIAETLAEVTFANVFPYKQIYRNLARRKF